MTKIIWTPSWPLGNYFAAYVDPIKSKPHVGVDGKLSNTLGLPFWIPEQRYLANFEDYQLQFSKLELVEFIVADPIIGEPLIKYYVEKGKKGIYDGKSGNGMISMYYSQFLMAYRKREDGLLGLESVSGQTDTRLSTFEKEKYPGVFPDNAKATSTTKANFSSVNSEFSDSRKPKKSKI